MFSQQLSRNEKKGAVDAAARVAEKFKHTLKPEGFSGQVTVENITFGLSLS